MQYSIYLLLGIINAGGFRKEGGGGVRNPLLLILMQEVTW